MPNLSNFDHVSIYDLMDMNLTFPYNKLNFNNAIDSFMINFYNKYKYSPDLKYASVGYEIGMYFLNILFQHGSILNYVESEPPNKVLETIYDFQKLNFISGYQNKGIIFLRYHDFGYQRIY